MLALRSRHEQSTIKNICLHHEQELLKKFSTLQRKCCDPLSLHPDKLRTKSLQVVSLATYEQLVNTEAAVVPGDKVCCACSIELSKLKKTEASVDDDVESESELEGNFVSDGDDHSMCVSPPGKDTSIVDVNTALAHLDGTPVKTGKMRTSSRKKRGKQKLKSATITLKRKLETSYDVTLESSESDQEPNVNDIKLFHSMIQELKTKFKNSNSYSERLQILTLSPFGIERTMKEFGATNYLVKKSRAVKKKEGILGQCEKNKGKALPMELKNEIMEFYENDDNSRMCPGMKECIKVKDRNGTVVKHQKRLVLANLKELHVLWTESHPDKKVGFSTFASLRPKWCVLAGASGTHSVCVCKYHQNPKLMVEACLKSDVHDLMKFCVCSNENEACMMGQCKDCPGHQGLADHLNQTEELTDIDEVTYKQWVSTDRTQLVTIVESKEEFVEKLATQVSKLTRHSYTAKSQSSYMKTLKSNMTPLKEMIVQGDFAENYSYVVQDEIQSFHWENKQATLHPFVAYCTLEDGTLVHRNVCVVSDCRDHSTVTVFAFLKVVLEYLRMEFPEVKKVHYFTDGCAGQYKNKYNFVNLCHHFNDFGLDAEWNFFATSHGKSACDGIGGTVKRLVTKASLQRPYNNQILTSDAVLDFCQENIPGIKFFNVTPDEIQIAEGHLKDRFETAQTVKGTLQFHRFVPVSKSVLKVYKLSSQVNPPALVHVTADESEMEDMDIPEPLQIEEQGYVCCLYDNLPWIGRVEEISDEFGDYHITFMHPSGPAKQFHWPSHNDQCWVKESDILCAIGPPFPISSCSRYLYYYISDEGVNVISRSFPNWETQTGN